MTTHCHVVITPLSYNFYFFFYFLLWLYQVDPEPYWDICTHDTCSCPSVGDCACFCNTIAAYAHECAQKGLLVNWRSNDLCRKFHHLASHLKVIFSPTSYYKPNRLYFFCRIQIKTLCRMFTLFYTMKVNGIEALDLQKWQKTLLKLYKFCVTQTQHS